ncbi:oxygen-independent coproporphyrinogen III oxidase [Acaryochloris marina]|uniref:Coproporphyrinogen-III oxidase n=1 Tax=Acaryochloris marina (strain MBIC 11017) TaxID=329726 RepID=B0CB33_ACAM1|nr:oxygen-independent coproporphyrinogen III oxidase [Acaryochloris marina]ABW25523.1 oxygen-independent coproporphyrinogen III oxidase [Acaryochloris marina MBIC11017]BDM80405.1 coproporphyrinogen-III oxidase [Acaryochloris marina MBIC10699]
MELLSTVRCDLGLLNKYDQPLPRYTSYPPATEFSSELTPERFQQALAKGNDQQIPLSLYCHIPFCETPCFFCGCNTVITQRKQVADPYLQYLIRNIRQVAEQVGSDRNVHQLHWGGGTPNYLSWPQIELLWNALQDAFSFDPAAEISIEVNPCYIDRNTVFFLRELGFNRISFGIQDFDPQVQIAVNRIQSEELLFNVISWIQEADFDSVNVDLIYGLPHQTVTTFANTVQKTIQLNPDRIAVFNFAYMPQLIPVQRQLPAHALPHKAEKLEMLQQTIDQLEGNGYRFIGMDHFAKPKDELALAQTAGQLHRNFQGYTTKPESDLLGFGLSAISMLQDVYTQNHKRLKDYYHALDTTPFPIAKGVGLSEDDQVRRAVIMELMCQFQLSQVALEEKYQLKFDPDFEQYFASEKTALQALAADGLVELSPNQIQVTPTGRLLIRNIAAVFDIYLQSHADQRFSQSI